MSDRVGRSRERIARARAKLRRGWSHALPLPLGECGAAAGKGPLAAPSLVASTPLVTELSTPSWLSRRRVLQGSLLMAAAGLAAALPRGHRPELSDQPAIGPQPSQTTRRIVIDPGSAEARHEAHPGRHLAEPKPAPVGPPLADRKLALYNENTGESVTATYWSGGDYVLEELESIDWVLRDHHVDEMRAIDLKLLDALYALRNKLETKEPLHILSAYRTPLTNAKLAERYDGVALHSFHILGKAVDLYVPGMRKRDLLKAARALKAGGVGNYRTYVHFDSGPRRYW